VENRAIKQGLAIIVLLAMLLGSMASLSTFAMPSLHAPRVRSACSSCTCSCNCSTATPVLWQHGAPLESTCACCGTIPQDAAQPHPCLCGAPTFPIASLSSATGGQSSIAVVKTSTVRLMASLRPISLSRAGLLGKDCPTSPRDVLSSSGDDRAPPKLLSLEKWV
jgi:hypothetical protein